jgi:hypothetical protein
MDREGANHGQIPNDFNAHQSIPQLTPLPVAHWKRRKCDVLKDSTSMRGSDKAFIRASFDQPLQSERELSISGTHLPFLAPPVLSQFSPPDGPRFIPQSASRSSRPLPDAAPAHAGRCAGVGRVRRRNPRAAERRRGAVVHNARPHCMTRFISNRHFYSQFDSSTFNLTTSE